MNKPPRFELTFGKKDEDLYAYIESFGLPKAPLVKKWIREHMENSAGSKPISVDVPEVKKSKENEDSRQLKDEDSNIPVTKNEANEEMKKSPFGGLAQKR